MSVNQLLSSATESISSGMMYNNLYYDSSNCKKSHYKVVRDNKYKLPFTTLTFGSTQIAFVIQNLNLMGALNLALTYGPGTLNPLPVLNTLAKISYQIGSSQVEDLYKNNNILDQMLQFYTNEKRSQYIANVGGNGGVISANTTYFATIDVPWSKMLRKMRLPVDTRMLSSNITIYIDLEIATNVYSSGTPPASLVSGYIQPEFLQFVNSSDNMKLIGYDVETRQQVQSIYAYPITYTKAFNKLISASGPQSIDITSFLPGMVGSIAFCFLPTGSSPGTYTQLSDLLLTYNGDVLSRYDGLIYNQFNLVEKNTQDIFQLNSVNEYIYEIPLGQHNMYNNLTPASYEYSMSLNSQTLQLAFTCSAAGTIYYNIMYRKNIIFDGVTANIV